MEEEWNGYVVIKFKTMGQKVVYGGNALLWIGNLLMPIRIRIRLSVLIPASPDPAPL